MKDGLHKLAIPAVHTSTVTMPISSKKLLEHHALKLSKVIASA